MIREPIETVSVARGSRLRDAAFPIVYAVLCVAIAAMLAHLWGLESYRSSATTKAWDGLVDLKIASAWV